MTIWIIALMLFFFCSGLGYRAGAIRVLFTILGIPVAALTAMPLGNHLKTFLLAMGVTSPILLAILGPLIVFIVVISLFKAGGFAAHRPVDVYYRYKAGELRFTLFERLNTRLGACLGLVTALMYLVIICNLIYLGSYWTVQLTTPDLDLKTAKYLDNMGHDLQDTGMNKVAVAADHMPDAYYQAADVVGLIYQNPLLEARLARYPGFLSLAELPELKALANDSAYTEMLMDKAPIGEIFKQDQTQGILNNRDLMQTICTTVGTNLPDLRVFLETGKSQTFDDPIYGEWYYDGKASIAAYRAAKPNQPSSSVAKVHRWEYAHFTKMTLIVSPDGKEFLKSFPKPDSQNIQLEDSTGNWKKNDTDYTLSFDGQDKNVEVDDNKMTVQGVPLPMILAKQE